MQTCRYLLALHANTVSAIVRIPSVPTGRRSQQNSGPKLWHSVL